MKCKAEQENKKERSKQIRKNLRVFFFLWNCGGLTFRKGTNVICKEWSVNSELAVFSKAPAKTQISLSRARETFQRRKAMGV